MSSPYGFGPSAEEGIANALARNAAGKDGNNWRFSGLAAAPSSAGQSSRLAAHRAKMGRDANGVTVASIAPTGRSTVSTPAAGAPAPGKASISAQSAAPTRPAAKISDEQLRLNHRSFAVLSHPKAEGKGRAVMAMLNAKKGLTAAQAITRLGSLPFDDAKREAEAKANAASNLWDAAHASAFPNYRAAAEPPKAAQDGAAARTSNSDTKPSASDIWNQAYTRVFGVEDTNPTTPTARSKPNTADVWDQALAGLKASSN